MRVSVMAGTTIGAPTIGPVVGFVLWVLILVWIYNLAKRKGRHPVGWLILGFLFSFIALIVLALLPSKLTTDRHLRG
jgi:4-hydroxybenzoate polyprenyltransferase